MEPDAALGESLLKTQINDAYRNLGGGPVAVRSAGAREDELGASQRGQFRTMLNVSGVDALWDAVEAVRADGLHAGARIGILVQLMVRPRSAGVMFTVSPESPAETLIESAWGLGMSVVEGRPVDRYVIDRDTLEVHVTVAEKPDMAMASRQGGVSRVACPDEKRSGPSLTIEDARRLASIGLELEREWSAPLDLEWAIDGDQVWILQARLIPEPDSWDSPSPPNPNDVWSRWAMADLFPDPVSPFTWSLASEHWSAVRRGSYRRFSPPDLDSISFFRLYDTRMYFNVGAAARLVALAGGSPTPARELGASGSAWSVSGPTGPVARRSWWRFPGSVIALVAGYWSVRTALRELDAAPAAARRYQDVVTEDLEARELWKSFLELWDEVTWLEQKEGRVDDEVFGAVRHLEALCDRWLGGREVVSELLISRDRDDIASGLSALAGARAEGHREGLQDRLSEFLARHGHRARGELDLAQPRWIEDPAPVMKLLVQGSGGTVDNRTRADPEAGERLVRSRLRTLPMERWLPWREVVFGVALARARRLIPLRSMPRDRVMHLFLAGRRMLVKLGDRLAAAGALETGEDLFFLTVTEISELLDRGSEAMHATAIAERRRLQLARAALRPAPEILGPEGEVLEERLPDHGSRRGGQVSLTGRGAAPGIAEGPVRVIRSPSDSGSIRLGDVLVLPAGDLGSTLYFPMAAALVVERGSLLSHAVVLAREYGLPTVVGVLSANALEDGAWVRVDGSRGTVSVVPQGARGAANEGPG